jgi:hypothetical protein
MTWNSENECYYERHRLSNGQYCMVAFYRFYRSRSVEYHVVFAVADKKKALNGYFDQTKDNNISLKYTGRCGAAALRLLSGVEINFSNLRMKSFYQRHLRQRSLFTVRIIVGFVFTSGR